MWSELAGKDAGAPTGATRAPTTAERGIYSATAPGGLKSALPGHFRSRHEVIQPSLRDLGNTKRSTQR